MRPRLRFVVADAFQLTPSRCVLVPGFDTTGPAVSSGDCIILRRPSGTFLRTTISGFELVNVRPRPEPIAAPISLPAPLKKRDVPVGTVVTVLEPPAHANDVFLFEVADSRTQDHGVMLSPARNAEFNLEPDTQLLLIRPDDTTLGARVLAASIDQILVGLASAEETPEGTLVFVAGKPNR